MLSRQPEETAGKDMPPRQSRVTNAARNRPCRLYLPGRRPLDAQHLSGGKGAWWFALLLKLVICVNQGQLTCYFWEAKDVCREKVAIRMEKYVQRLTKYEGTVE